jgi:hypothetical protein
MPGRQTILTVAVALVAIMLVAAGALFVYPMLTSGGISSPPGQGNGTPATTTSPSILKPIVTPIVKETPPPVIPPTGVQVHVNYLGGFKGSYGVSDIITTVPGNSGERVWEVENATNSTVLATFEKLDGSPHELLVEIYNNGKLVTSGTTTVGHGSVALSYSTATGIAAAPVTSGGGTAKTTPAAAATTIAVVNTTAPAVNATTIKTTTVTTATVTTTAAVNTTTATP